MNHAQDYSLNFEFLFKGSISSEAIKKQLLELLQKETAGEVGFLVPIEKLFLLVAGCTVGKPELRTHRLPEVYYVQSSNADSWIRAMEEFDRF